jgi:hypothetical protein
MRRIRRVLVLLAGCVGLLALYVPAADATITYNHREPLRRGA